MVNTRPDWHARKARARAYLAGGVAKKKAWDEQFYAYDYQEDDMTFLHWFDDNPKKPVYARLIEAVQAYRARLGTQPNLILVNEADAGATFAGCEVRVEKRIGPNIYHVGRTDA